MPTSRPAITAALTLILAAGCSPGGAPGGDSAAGQSAGQPAPAEQARPLACALVTAAEMSAILGSEVIAEPDDRSAGRTGCIYRPPAGPSPYVELSVDWDGGEAAMTAMGMMGKMEPGIASPYEGIGDQAAAVGPTLMIRTGPDLVNLVFSGITDAPAIAKRIFDTAKPRM
jgi:hypothetical protein